MLSFEPIPNLWFWVIMSLIVLKSSTIGSEFNFYYLLKDGKMYWRWYMRRQTYSQYKEERCCRNCVDGHPDCGPWPEKGKVCSSFRTKK
jgi:hypothetical protein